VKKSADVGIDGAVGAFEDRRCGQAIILNRRAGLKTVDAVIEAIAVEKLSVSEMAILHQVRGSSPSIQPSDFKWRQLVTLQIEQVEIALDRGPLPI